MNKPKISVVIPLYNKEKSIARTIESILNQTLHDFELVIVDDGSTDNSVDIVRSFSDERIVLIQQKNAGPGAARNTGVRNAKADWIVFLDADDENLPDSLEFFAKMIDVHPEADIIDTGKYLRRGKELIKANHPIDGWVKNPMKECFFLRVLPGAGFSVFRKSLLARCPYNEKIRRFEDAELLLRLLDGAKVYSSKKITSIHDFNYAEASRPRKNVEEDYFAYLDFNTGGFWRKMCVYRTYLEERIEYPEAAMRLYGHMRYRYDWLIAFKLLNKFKILFS